MKPLANQSMLCAAITLQLVVYLSGCSAGTSQNAVTSESPKSESIVDSESAKKPELSLNNYWQPILSKQANAATHIIHGKITEVTAEKGRMNTGDTFVESTVSLNVVNVYKGNRIRQFRSLGGVLDGLVYSYSDIPIFFTGEEVVIFLEEENDIPVIPFGYVAAKFLVTPEGTLSPSGLRLDDLTHLIGKSAEGK